MTLMGDVVVPHGGEVWLGALIQLAAPLGIGDRLVRTSVYRLKSEGWIDARRDGRRSYYQLTPSGANTTRQAERRIYHAPENTWSGAWHLIFVGSTMISQVQRNELKKQLRWLGFGLLGPNMFGHPVANLQPVRQLLKDMGLEQSVMIMYSRTIGEAGSKAAQDMAQQCCDLDDLERQYRAFNGLYGDFAEQAVDNPMDSFILRLMIIHDFRRILLRDPTLPEALLPEDWQGSMAFNLCARIYRNVWAASEQFIETVLPTLATRKKSASIPHFNRFPN
jgi:phenylacetic acid degradation operon negative regulatory protein